MKYLNIVCGICAWKFVGFNNLIIKVFLSTAILYLKCLNWLNFRQYNMHE
jgi:hypothetical protein